VGREGERYGPVHLSGLEKLFHKIGNIVQRRHVLLFFLTSYLLVSIHTEAPGPGIRESAEPIMLTYFRNPFVIIDCNDLVEIFF
jgi:hypothetical protein